MATDRNKEVKISGAYIMKESENKPAKEPMDKHLLVNVTTVENSVTISVNRGKEDQVPLLGHRISMKGMGIKENDGALFNIKWYEKSNVAYDALAADKWTDLYPDNHDALLFDGLGESIEDFPLAKTGSDRTLEFAVLAEIAGIGGAPSVGSFFMNAEQITAGNTSTLTIHHCGTVSSADADTLDTYLGLTLQGSADTFMLPASVTITDTSKEFSVKNVYRCKYE